ncbi:MAG: tail fiber protein [Candidatus Omnitrophica bacterium]|nr:tail fiber protein [Candidatus Omnitrophota bacterium]
MPLFIQCCHSSPPILNYQGRLTDSTGNNPITQPVTLTFSFYDDEDGGALLGDGYSYQITVTPNNQGFVSTLIGGQGGQGGAVPRTIFASQDVFLNVNMKTQGMSVGEDLRPRIPMLSVPYAFYSDHATNSDHASTSDSAMTATTATNAMNAVTATSATTAVNADNAANLGGQPPSHYGVPAGTIVAFGGSAPPTGWLLCDGVLLDKVGTYAALFAAIGSSFTQPGDPVTKFRVPDLRGVFIRGLDDRSPSVPDRDPEAPRTIGQIQLDSFESHNHLLWGAVSCEWGGGGYGPGLNFTGTTAGGRGGHIHRIGTTRSGTCAAPTYIPPDSETGVNARDAAMDKEGGPETRPVNMALYYIIKY